MESIKSNIQELRKIINEDNFKIDEAIEFLDAIETNADDLEEELESANDEIKDLESQVDDLKSEINEMETDNLEKIDCGIDVIEYKSPGNLVLMDVMDNLAAAIQKHTPKKVNDILSALN